MGEVANMLGDKIGIWKEFGRFSVQNNKIIGSGLNEKALIRLTIHFIIIGRKLIWQWLVKKERT